MTVLRRLVLSVGIAASIEGAMRSAVQIPPGDLPRLAGQWTYPNDPLDTTANGTSWCLNNDGVCGSGRPDPLIHTFWPLTAHTDYHKTNAILEDAAINVVAGITVWWAARTLLSGLPTWTPPLVPVFYNPPPPPPMDGLFLYNSTTGASYTEQPDGNGGWINGVRGPTFSPGWQVYPGTYSTDNRTGLFLYNPSTGDNYTEFADAAGQWYGIKGPYFSPGWNVYPGDFTGDGRTDLFVYNPSTGVNYVELADGSGGWTGGGKGPYFSPGWNVYPGVYS